ncbi:hypothetical protein [Frigoriglobus tundricola]|uniref:hypothetical protein n=1 Tax=Frigoriglobus tundricola TaxID=2774151 RepID=UPI00148E9F1E|nr:hypothetical protein [Frigoriglobus tundricola]
MIAAAQVMPGFSDDLSRWRITISHDGGLRQEIFLAISSNMYCDELRREAVQLRPADVDEILALADRIGFRGFRDSYSHETMVVTDLPCWFISVRFGAEVKTVHAYGPYSIAREENNRDMAGFVELWERIHRHVPYPKAEPRVAPDPAT